MKILSKMLSRKIEPQEAPDLDPQDEERTPLADDSGRANASKSRDALFARPDRPVRAKAEEPEVAGSGWESGDWDDSWDEDEDWGDEELDPEERKKSRDKQHLVSEIREAMVSVSHVKPDAPDASDVDDDDDWADDEEFGRRARARSQLTAAADDERILEKTETVMSDRETSRRRSAMAHMKAAAAATKADRVLRHVASQDPSADPEEQSPYRDDLAKVVRPHSKSRPISRQVSRPNAPTPLWDQGAGDEDAALFAAAEDGVTEDPAVEIADELSAAEAERLARTPAALSEEDFAEDQAAFASEKTVENDFPASPFADDADELEGNAFEDFDEDDFDDDLDDDDDFEPIPSRVVSEAVAYANAPDEEIAQPEEEVRKKIWEMADEVASEVEGARAMSGGEEPLTENLANITTSVAGRAGRGAGRVKTRLLGFQAEDEAQDVFEKAAEKAAAMPGTAAQVMFPAGWIVVVDGPGRGASFTLINGVSQIGRGEDQAVRLDFGDTSISRNNHAAVAYDDEQGKFFLGHGGKSNLVRLNGMPVLSTEEMADGDTIRIGETLLKFVALCGDEFTWSGSNAGDNAANA